MNDEQRTQLNEQGYLIFKSLLSPEQVGNLLARLEELWVAEGEKAGGENYIEPGARRLANLASKGDLFREIYAHPQVLEVVEAVMGPEIRASMVNARDVPSHTDALPYGLRQRASPGRKRLQRRDRHMDAGPVYGGERSNGICARLPSAGQIPEAGSGRPECSSSR